MYEEDRKLAEACEKLARETVSASAWLADNAELVGRDLQGHTKELRRAGRVFRGCARAAARKMCAGVFGPSQAGKSYLVSTLAGNSERKLWTELGGETYDFLTDINPAGGKESTGLVTRFTLTRPMEPPQGFPVHVRLLSLSDVVKILANTYYSDAKHMEEPDRAAALTILTDLEKRATAAPTGGLSEDDVEDLQEYIHKYFRDKPRVQQILDRHFWERVIPLAPRLEDGDRAKLFGIIWDGIEPFTRLLLELSRTLRSIGYAADAFCPVTALVPRAESIIDVEALSNLSTGEGTAIELRLPEGGTLTVPKVYVAALTAELIIGMREKPADFFGHTDLLDFPGYRSREIFPNLAQNVQDPKNLELCFLRGKVEYLFQRYCAERELTSLLLCIGPSVLEVKGLDGAVDDWVRSTHGETPEARAGKETALFFILSKSDMEFENKAGVTDVSDRWDIRIESSLIKSFAQHSKWPTAWDDKGEFKHLFLMRNTTIKLALFEHDADKNETGIKPEEKGYVSEFERAFMNSAKVKNFCAHQRETWDSFMTPNDGGIAFIRQKLAPICKPELKRSQIRGSLEETLTKLRERLRPYWKTDDKEQERIEKDLLAKKFARIMLTMAQNQRFGQFLRLLLLRDQDVYDLYFQARHRIQEELASQNAGAATAAVGTRVSADDMLADLLGDEAAAVAPTASAPSSASATSPQPGAPLPQDEAQAFAGHIETFWREQLRAVAEDAVLHLYLPFPAAEFSDFVSELGKGFVRLGIRSAMEEALRKAERYANTEKERIVWKQASLATETVNSYVDWLGLNPRVLDENARTVTIAGKQRALFTPPPAFRGLPAIGEDPTPYDRAFYTDWTAALMHLVAENVNFDGVRDFDPVQNSRLRAILDNLTLQ